MIPGRGTGRGSDGKPWEGYGPYQSKILSVVQEMQEEELLRLKNVNQWIKEELSKRKVMVAKAV